MSLSQHTTAVSHVFLILFSPIINQHERRRSIRPFEQDQLTVFIFLTSPWLWILVITLALRRVLDVLAAASTPSCRRGVELMEVLVKDPRPL